MRVTFIAAAATIVAWLADASAAHAQRTAPVAPGVATQGGSLPLTDVMALAKAYPNLITEIRLRLLAAGQKKEAVVCTANRFPGDWNGLGGTRFAPYACKIGTRTLTITAAQTYYDRNGYRLGPTDPALRTKATRLAEARFKWSWR